MSEKLIATAELERVLCSPHDVNKIAELMPPSHDAWTATFPDLTAIPRPPVDAAKRRLKICIATEDIVGPVRNGGIGTTYTALAELLAQQNHDTTILYLRGKESETGTIEEWIEHYAARGVKFVPVADYAQRDAFHSESGRWLRAPYNMFRHLIEHPMDVVHVSEWRGSGFLSLLAKRQGIAFHNTLFIVKASSPWLWNRMYALRAIDRLEDLAKIYAERRSIELADMVIGGSTHLLQWMLSQGYQLPRARTFVQPNVINFDHLAALINPRGLQPGSRIPVDEIVFFGRLEARKGLFTFCQAIRRLMRQGHTLPPTISFMGKPGAKLSARPNQAILEYIESETKDWPTKVQILTSFQQQQAIEYLLGGVRLAVMPSAIENSSLAVYEAAICGVPFIASSVGGTPELVAAADHEHVLCHPHPIHVAERIAEALDRGAYIASASFDNRANLDAWRAFHADLGRGLQEQLLRLPSANTAAKPQPSVSICIYYTGNAAALSRTLATIEQQRVLPEKILIGVDAPDPGALAEAERLVSKVTIPYQVIDASDHDVGLAFNALAEHATSKHVLFLWEGTQLHRDAIGVLDRVAFLSGAEVLNCFYREIKDPQSEELGPLKAKIIGNIAEAFFQTDIAAEPLFVARETFLRLEGFTTDFRVLSCEHEFVSKAQLSGVRCETALVELAGVPVFSKEWLSKYCYDVPTSHFRAIRPQLATAPLAVRDLLLMAKGLSMRPAQRRVPEDEDGLLLSLGRFMRRRRTRQRGGGAGLLESLLELANGDGGNLAAPRRAVEALKQARYDRKIFYVRSGVICGWVVDTNDPDAKVGVEAIVKGRVVASTIASGVANAAPLQNELRANGFALRMFPKWKRSWWGSGAQSFDIRVAGTDHYLVRGLKLSAPSWMPDRSRFEGYTDRNGMGVVAGWVWCPDNPEIRISVAVFVDGQFVGCALADMLRQDLALQGIGNGEFGFHLRLDEAYFDGAEHKVEVLVASTGMPLPGSPLILRGRQLSRATREYSPRVLLDAVKSGVARMVF